MSFGPRRSRDTQRCSTSFDAVEVKRSKGPVQVAGCLSQDLAGAAQGTRSQGSASFRVAGAGSPASLPRGLPASSLGSRTDRALAQGGEALGHGVDRGHGDRQPGGAKATPRRGASLSDARPPPAAASRRPSPRVHHYCGRARCADRSFAPRRSSNTTFRQRSSPGSRPRSGCFSSPDGSARRCGAGRPRLRDLPQLLPRATSSSSTTRG